MLILVMARPTFPQELAGSDLRAYDFEQSKIIWGLAALFVAMAQVRVLTLGTAVPQADARGAAHVMRLAALLLCIVLAVSKRRQVHEVGPGSAMLLMIARIASSNVAFGG